MSQIINALKKVREKKAETGGQDPIFMIGELKERTVNPIDEPRINRIHSRGFQRILISVALIIAVMAGFLSVILYQKMVSVKNEINAIHEVIDTQEVKLKALAQKTGDHKAILDMQIQHLTDRMNETGKNLKDQIGALAQSNNSQYAQIKQVMLDDRQTLNLLTGNIQKLDQKSEQLKNSINQIKNTSATKQSLTAGSHP